MLLRSVRAGVPGGIIAGVVMAAWSMAAMWVTGAGLWTPLNLVAHTFYRSAPLGAAFSAPAMIIGLAVHTVVAVIFGIAIALLAGRLPGARAQVIAGGILFVAVVWPVMQWLVWYQLDPVAAQALTAWIFAVAHLLFGLIAGGIASIGIDNTAAGSRGRHALGSTRLRDDDDRAAGVPGQPAGDRAGQVMPEVP